MQGCWLYVYVEILGLMCFYTAVQVVVVEGAEARSWCCAV